MIYVVLIIWLIAISAEIVLAENRIKQFAAESMKKQTDEFDQSLAELMTIIFNAEGIKAKAAEHPGETIDLEKLI